MDRIPSGLEQALAAPPYRLLILHQKDDGRVTGEIDVLVAGSGYGLFRYSGGRRRFRCCPTGRTGRPRNDWLNFWNVAGKEDAESRTDTDF